MVQERRWGCFFAVVIGLLYFAASAASQEVSSDDGLSCPHIEGFDLKDYELDLVLTVPNIIGNKKFFRSLTTQWEQRLSYFREQLGEEFQSVSITMVQVKSEGREGSDCLGEPFTDVADFAKQQVQHKAKAFAHNLLLGAALVPSYIKPEWISSTTSSDPTSSKTIRVVVMLGERYVAEDDIHIADLASEHVLPNQFVGDGSDTCASFFPSQQLVKDMFARSDIHLLLVTPRARTQAKWNKAFPEDDCLLYSFSAPSKSRAKFIYDESKDEVPGFVRNRVVQYACAAFLQAKDGKGTTVLPVAPTTATLSEKQPLVTTTPEPTTTTESVPPIPDAQ